MESREHEESEVREGTEDSECCAEKKGKAKCSACAAGKPCSGRSDALTAQDYLLACDLGIADRSRPYIRARLDAMASLTPAAVQLRTDKKCGASAIPDNKQCRVGASGAPASGGKRKGGFGRQSLETVGMVAGAGLAVGGLANSVRQANRGNLKGVGRSLYVANAGNAITGLSMRARGKRTGNKEMVKQGNQSLSGAAVGTGLAALASGDLGRAGRAGMRGLGRTAFAAGSAAGRAQRASQGMGARVAENFGRRNARRGAYTTTATRVRGGSLARRTSMWADGFSLDTAALEA